MVKLKNRAVKKGIIVALLIVVVVALTGITVPVAVSVTEGGHLSFGSDIILSVQQDGEPEPQEIVEPTFSRGGLPIRSIEYNTDGCILRVKFNGLAPLNITERDITNWSSIEAVEAIMNSLIEGHLEGRGYGAVHVYSLEPFRFTTKFSKEVIEGEWWE